MGNTKEAVSPPSAIAATYKVIFLGGSGHGRTSLLTRICENTFSECPESTIGVKFFVQRHENCKFEFWDTAGQERFDEIDLVHTRGCHLLMISIDCTSSNSLSGARKWKQKLLTHYGVKELPPIILVLTKSDLAEKRVVMKDQLRTLALEIKANVVYETSAKTGDNIQTFIPVLHSLVTSQRPSETNNVFYYENEGVELIPCNEHKIFIDGMAQAGKKSCLSAILPTGQTRHVVWPYVYQPNLANHQSLNVQYDSLFFVVDATNINSLLGCGQLLTLALTRLSRHLAPRFLIVNKCHDRDLSVISRALLIMFAQRNHFCAVIELDGFNQKLATDVLSLLNQYVTQPAPTQHTYYALSGTTETYEYLFFFNPHLWFPTQAELSENNFIRTIKPSDYCAQAAIKRQEQMRALPPEQNRMGTAPLSSATENQGKRQQPFNSRVADAALARKRIEKQQKEEQAKLQQQSIEKARIDALPNAKKCTICHNSDDLHLIFPCGHYPICPTCADRSNEKCPFCRSNFPCIVKMFPTVSGS